MVYEGNRQEIACLLDWEYMEQIQPIIQWCHYYWVSHVQNSGFTVCRARLTSKWWQWNQYFCPSTNSLWFFDPNSKSLIWLLNLWKNVIWFLLCVCQRWGWCYVTKCVFNWILMLAKTSSIVFSRSRDANPSEPNSSIVKKIALNYLNDIGFQVHLLESY